VRESEEVDWAVMGQFASAVRLTERSEPVWAGNGPKSLYYHICISCGVVCVFLNQKKTSSPALRRVPVGGVELGELGREGGMANNVVLCRQIAASWTWHDGCVSLLKFTSGR
jgi:hypothetical protein